MNAQSSNNLQEAANLLRKGWCVGELYRRDADAYCAVGALAAVLNVLSQLDDKYEDVDVYNALEKTPEIRALAETIFEQYSDLYEVYDIHNREYRKALNLDDLIEYQKGSNPDYPIVGIVFGFNDDTAHGEDEVIAIFEKAGTKLDS